MRPTSARAHSPPASTPTRSPTRSWPTSSAARERDQKRKRDDHDREQHEGERNPGAQHAPALDDADPVGEQAERPGGEAAEKGVEDRDASTRVGAAGAE